MNVSEASGIQGIYDLKIYIILFCIVWFDIVLIHIFLSIERLRMDTDLNEKHSGA